MLLHNVRTRFGYERWYSWMGPILLCVNPFQWTTGLYTRDVIQYYVDSRVQKLSGHDTPPHVFAGENIIIYFLTK
jgi:myosin heavy subunit